MALALKFKSKKDPRLGWKKDPYDPKAWIFKPSIPRIPADIDWRQYMMAVQDQGNSGSCVGFGVDGIGTGELNFKGMKLPDYQLFSPTDIYNGGRYIDGSLASDEGTWASSALEWLRQKGWLPYKFWPYAGFEKRSRPSTLDIEAAKYPLKGYTPLTLGYYRVTNGIDGILAALAEKHMVAIGVPWPDKWMDTKDGVLALPKSTWSIAGGHEVYLWGANTTDKVVRGANSWGISSWSYSGKVVPKGCFTMPFGAFDWFKCEGGYDAHFITVEWGETPTPVPPEPTPVPAVSLPPYIMGSQDDKTWTSYSTK